MLLLERARRVRASGCSGADELAGGIDVGDGLVLTVAHALRGARTVTVDDSPGTMVALDHRIDAALVMTDGRLPPIGFAAGRPGPASVVTDRGTPPIDVTRRVTVRIDEPRDGAIYERAALILDASMEHGDSGSGVVDNAGRLVGMVFAASRQTPRAHAVLPVARFSP